jgi:hypothetical protein
MRNKTPQEEHVFLAHLGAGAAEKRGKVHLQNQAAPVVGSLAGTLRTTRTLLLN